MKMLGWRDLFFVVEYILIKLEENEVSDWKENYVIICNYKKWNWL